MCVCVESLCVASRELCVSRWLGVFWLATAQNFVCTYEIRRTTEIWDGLANKNIPLGNIMSADKTRVVSCIQNL